MILEKWETSKPEETNGYGLFDAALEDDPLVFFHVTPLRNRESILAIGFQSARRLGCGPLDYVAYAQRSSECLAVIRNMARQEYAVFAVRFRSPDQLIEGPTGMEVRNPATQPEILGYCVLAAEY